MSHYFSEPYEPFGGDINVKVVEVKVHLRNTTGIDTSKLAAKSDLASLKAKVDKTDVDKLKPVPADLSKLSNVVNNDAVKKNCV